MCIHIYMYIYITDVYLYIRSIKLLFRNFICRFGGLIDRVYDTRSCVRHGSFSCATRLIHMCDMTHSHVGHVSFTCVT